MKIIPPHETGLPPNITSDFLAFGRLPDGTLCGIQQFLHTWGLLVNVDDVGYSERYCYPHAYLAGVAMLEWDGEGDPEGWIKHKGNGNDRRPGEPRREDRPRADWARQRAAREEARA